MPTVVDAIRVCSKIRDFLWMAVKSKSEGISHLLGPYGRCSHTGGLWSPNERKEPRLSLHEEPHHFPSGVFLFRLSNRSAESRISDAKRDR